MAVKASYDSLPLRATLTPASQEETQAAVQDAYRQNTPLYPIGGGTSLDHGLPAREPGLGLSLTGLKRVVDYPARDLTITVEAGMTLAALRETLAAEHQWLPIDAPEPETATLGGLIATNFSGPRRFGYGTMRDYLIGVTAIDGRGVMFHGGGRVVKNVAGYDFCKLLIGSLGTLGVVVQATLKVKPLPEASAFVVQPLAKLADAEPLLQALVNSRTTPAAVELLAGPAWAADPALASVQTGQALVVGLEGTAPEVEYMQRQLLEEWRPLGAGGYAVAQEQVQGLWERLTTFTAQRQELVIQASVLPSAVVGLAQTIQSLADDASIMAHAACGTLIARLPSIGAADVAPTMIRTIQPAARAASGSITALALPPDAERTRQLVWGPATEGEPLMRAVKEQFDPQGLLNPGRFIY
jgi:glycolate oxidase FAD binding subunit